MAYTTGWATFPAWYLWQQFGGKPVGPWAETGRYLQRAIVGVGNYLLLIKGERASVALSEARGFGVAFGVEGTLGLKTDGHGRTVIAWTLVPPKPTVPPADGFGPRPVPNSGS